LAYRTLLTRHGGAQPKLGYERHVFCIRALGAGILNGGFRDLVCPVSRMKERRDPLLT
jgi:hypothetical protein